MVAPLFVAVDDETWVQVSHIVAIAANGHKDRCTIYTTEGQRSEFVAHVPLQDFLNRMKDGLR